ncbi:MAG: 3-phosphoshikimate 1-carboxyvinyltransferase [Candidatus Saganbacteria bacterium]|nr:3-phosphoshikimate 1-carboxyvinyltransferase [Candidatus Saganbacteria bacterium]
MQLEMSPAKSIRGKISVPADKSISHRSIMLSALSDGKCLIENFLEAEDCMRTVECFRTMGIGITKDKDLNNAYIVDGKGMSGLSVPKDILYAGNSGTAIRLILGILAGQPFQAMITGDESIKKRPMLRVVEPLRNMGARITGRENGNFAPLEIKGGNLRSIDYVLPVASAQIKSSLMLASLFAEGVTRITEPAASRDHTERMFGHFGIPFTKKENTIHIGKVQNIRPASVWIPGDISSAAFFIVAALIVPGSEVLIKNVGLNPTRTGIIDVLHRMGAKIEIQNETILSGEPRGDIIARSSDLEAVDLSGNIIPRIIDEIPVIAVAAAFAEGVTTISDARELRVKESHRIAALSGELKKLGIKVEEKEDGLIIQGKNKIKGALCYSHGDHRIAMSLAIAALAAEDDVVIEDTDCIATSFPGFEKLLKGLSG